MARGSSQTCGVAVDGEGAGRERRAALVERGGERRPERGRVGGRERVVLVEDDAAEAGAAELGPVEPPDVLHRHVRQRQARLGRRDGRHRGHAGRVEPLPERAPPPRRRAHVGRCARGGGAGGCRCCRVGVRVRRSGRKRGGAGSGRA